jgi:hypothetical protein
MWFSDQAKSKEPVYCRSLPSGGYVAITTESVQPLFGAKRTRGKIVVERRAEERRVGHSPPIAAVAEHENVDMLLAALMPVAESDEILNNTLAQKVTIPITQRRPRTE